jgi:hypothetical protein
MGMGMRLWIVDTGNKRWSWCECIWDGFTEFGITHSVGVKGMVDWASVNDWNTISLSFSP